MGHVATDNPVRAALAEFESLDGQLAPVTPMTGVLGELPADEALHSDAVMAALVAGVRRVAGSDDQDAAAVLAAHWSWLVSLPARAVWAISRVVPDVHPANVAFLLDEYGVPQVALLKRHRFGCLAGDPVAGAADALVFATPET